MTAAGGREGIFSEDWRYMATIQSAWTRDESWMPTTAQHWNTDDAQSRYQSPQRVMGVN
jgi:hypothetical protein